MVLLNYLTIPCLCNELIFVIPFEINFFQICKVGMHLKLFSKKVCVFLLFFIGLRLFKVVTESVF